jgi:hypothetical protein
VNDTDWCAACGLRIHRAWPQSSDLNIVRSRQTDADGMIWRHHLEPQSDGHDPVVVKDPTP